MQPILITDHLSINSVKCLRILSSLTNLSKLFFLAKKKSPLVRDIPLAHLQTVFKLPTQSNQGIPIVLRKPSTVPIITN